MFSAMQILVVITMLGFAFCFSIKLMYFCVTPAISASFSCVIFFFNLLILIFSATFQLSKYPCVREDIALRP